MRKTPEVLVVEDNPGDACLTSSALNRDSHPCHITVATDGVKALAWLRERCDQGGTPDLVVLDLNLPRLDGRNLLNALKGDHLLRRIPVVVFSTSNAARDIESCYELGANCYVRKPANLNDFLAAADAISVLWLGPACLPDNQGRLNGESFTSKEKKDGG